MNYKRDKIKDAGYEKHYVYNAHYHLIWCTKYRNQIFTNQDLAQEMRDLLKQIAEDNQIKIEKISVHAHKQGQRNSERHTKAYCHVLKIPYGRQKRNRPDVSVPPRHSFGHNS